MIGWTSNGRVQMSKDEDKGFNASNINSERETMYTVATKRK